MDERDAFLTAVLPQITAADTSLHNGNAGPRIRKTWSHNDPVTLFGALMTVVGWSDLGYLVAVEHTTCSENGAPPAPYALRVTQIFRREAGEWKIVHRHADPVKEGAPADQETRLGSP